MYRRLITIGSNPFKMDKKKANEKDDFSPTLKIIRNVYMVNYKSIQYSENDFSLLVILSS